MSELFMISLELCRNNYHLNKCRKIYDSHRYGKSTLGEAHILNYFYKIIELLLWKAQKQVKYSSSKYFQEHNLVLQLSMKSDLYLSTNFSFATFEALLSL